MEILKLNLSEEKIKETKQFREKYIQKLSYVYEENCSFEMLEFLNESIYLTPEEKRLVLEKIEELNKTYKYVVDNKFIVVHSKKYNRKLVTVIFYINYKNKEKCYCVDLEILGNKLIVGEKLITLRSMIEIKTRLTEDEKVTEIVISGTKDIQARDFRVRIYTNYDTLQVDEEDFEHLKDLELEVLDNPYEEVMSVIENYKSEEGNVCIKNLINEYKFYFKAEFLDSDCYSSEGKFRKYLGKLIFKKK